jgi:hypothetical protein
MQLGSDLAATVGHGYPPGCKPLVATMRYNALHSRSAMASATASHHKRHSPAIRPSVCVMSSAVVLVRSWSRIPRLVGC